MATDLIESMNTTKADIHQAKLKLNEMPIFGICRWRQIMDIIRSAHLAILPLFVDKLHQKQGSKQLEVGFLVGETYLGNKDAVFGKTVEE